MNLERHWETVYQSKREDQVSWYRPHLEISLQLIENAVPDRNARIVDVGGGESTLVDDLLARSYQRIDVLDLSLTALEATKRRLGQQADSVRWICADVIGHAFERSSYDLWHDRAVFHFLTSADDRAAYVRQVAHAVKPGGHVIVAAFGPEGPTRCSGLDVVRYNADALHSEFGVRFDLVKHQVEIHRTPAGVEQQFVYCFCNLSSGAA